MNIRLVAYRKATSASTSDSAYNLDLQEVFALPKLIRESFIGGIEMRDLHLNPNTM